ncbi:MAG: hypothetical protein NTW87_10865 [Planctomycetota bacterium]|nr:hypothetical protein [Planctomycetota bacterium]
MNAETRSTHEYSRGSQVTERLLPNLRKLEALIGAEQTAMVTTKDEVFRRFLALRQQYRFTILDGKLMWQANDGPLASPDADILKAFCELNADAQLAAGR